MTCIVINRFMYIGPILFVPLPFAIFSINETNHGSNNIVMSWLSVVSFDWAFTSTGIDRQEINMTRIYRKLIYRALKCSGHMYL